MVNLTVELSQIICIETNAKKLTAAWSEENRNVLMMPFF